jgi:hypothetical protein
MIITFSVLVGLWLIIINLGMIDEKRYSTIAMVAVTATIIAVAVATQQPYILLAGYVLTLVHTFKDWTKWGIVGSCAIITIPIIFQHTTWILIIAIAIMVLPFLLATFFIIMLCGAVRWMMLTQ